MKQYEPCNNINNNNNIIIIIIILIKRKKKIKTEEGETACRERGFLLFLLFFSLLLSQIYENRTAGFHRS